MSAFTGVTTMDTVTVSTALSQTNLNVGEVYLADFDESTLTLSNKTSVWSPEESNWTKYVGTLDKEGNTYTADTILSTTYLEKGEHHYSVVYAQGSTTAAAKKAEKKGGIITGNENYLSKAKALGMEMYCVGSELNLIASGGKKVVQRILQ